MGMPSMGQQSFGPAAYPDPSGNIVNSGLMPSWPGQGGGSDSCSATDQVCMHTIVEFFFVSNAMYGLCPFRGEVI
jgi:hypothetical protein